MLFTFESEVPGQPAVASEIHARRADGSDARVLALPQAQASYPSITPDGTGLLYAGPSLQSLFLYDLAGGAEQQLDTTGQVGFGTVSPDGATVVYGDGNNLWVVGVGGALVQQLLVPSGSTPTGAAGYPAFERDSKTVVFAEGGALQSIATDGSGRATLLTEEDSDTFPNPALSPDGLTVAAVVSCDLSTYELRTYPLASLPAACASGAVVTTVPGSPPYYDLAWGPGGLIAYSGGNDVFLVSAAGGAPQDLTADLTGPDASASEPTWAPACAVLP